MDKFVENLSSDKIELVKQIIDYIDVEYPFAEIQEDNINRISYFCNGSSIALVDSEDSLLIYFDYQPSIKRISDNYSAAKAYEEYIEFSYSIPLPFILICSAIDLSFDV